MCGIAGIYRFDGRPLDRRTVRSMGDALAHRGPDDDRYYFWSARGGNELYRHQVPPAAEHAPVLGFAHRRLSIVDIASGHQPMTNEDASMWICYNGEVYNHLDLRRALRNEGHIFNTQSDTEAVLHQYEQFGPDGVKQLNGLFAYAIWDSTRRQLYLARDRFGVKPLYYTIHDGALVFASEIKAILQVPGIPRQPNPTTIAQHFTFMNHYDDSTFFQGIKLLPPGHWLLVDSDGNVTVQRYWRMEYRGDDTRDEDAIANELRAHFERGVERQLMSEVPLGTFLSGGMDTGSISAVAARRIPQMHTFTCGFTVPEGADSLEQYFDESAESFELADLLGTQHHEIRLSAEHNFPALPHVAWALDEPRLGISYQNWYTSQMIRRHVVVVLSGGGGDELFAGYHWRHSRALPFDDPAQWNRAYYREWVRFMDDGSKREDLFSDDFNRQLGGYNTYDDAFLPVMDGVQTRDPLARALHFDFHTFLHGLFVVEDKLSMAHSIEARVPFLDNDLVDFALGIPASLKLKDGTSKYILKRAMRGILPDETLVRRKQGFTPPDATWYRGPLRGEVEALLLSDRALERGYFQPEGVRCIVEQHMNGTHNHRFLLWSLLVFEWWNRLFLDGDPLPELRPEARETVTSDE